MLVRATENVVAGHIWTAGRYLPTPVDKAKYRAMLLQLLETHPIR